MVQQSIVPLQHHQRSTVAHQGHRKPDRLPALPELPTPLSCSGNGPLSSDTWQGNLRSKQLVGSAPGQNTATCHTLVKRKHRLICLCHYCGFYSRGQCSISNIGKTWIRNEHGYWYFNTEVRINKRNCLKLYKTKWETPPTNWHFTLYVLCDFLKSFEFVNFLALDVHKCVML